MPFDNLGAERAYERQQEREREAREAYRRAVAEFYRSLQQKSNPFSEIPPTDPIRINELF